MSVRDTVRSIMERALILVDATKFEDIHQLHIDIFDGIACRDPAKAQTAMEHHFDDVLARVDARLGHDERKKRPAPRTQSNPQE